MECQNAPFLHAFCHLNCHDKRGGGALIKVIYKRVLSTGQVWFQKPKAVLLTTASNNFSFFLLETKKKRVLQTMLAMYGYHSEIFFWKIFL